VGCYALESDAPLKKKAAIKVTHCIRQYLEICRHALDTEPLPFCRDRHGEPALTRQFPHDARKAAQAYLRRLKAADHNALLTQGEDALTVRFQNQGL
jgi:hypothetical protein